MAFWYQAWDLGLYMGFQGFCFSVWDSTASEGFHLFGWLLLLLLSFVVDRVLLVFVLSA